MEPLFAIAGLVLVGVITPGPNNFIVMSAAAGGGLRAAVPPSAGVVLGTLVLVFAAWTGAGAVFSGAPFLKAALRVAGALYLIWLGLLMLRPAGAAPDNAPRARLPSTFGGLAVFQFLNPKGWVLVLTAVAASPEGPADAMILAAIFAGLSSLCLAVWALAGQALSGWLRDPRRRLWFDRGMGAVLIGSAALLLVEP